MQWRKNQRFENYEPVSRTDFVVKLHLLKEEISKKGVTLSGETYVTEPFTTSQMWFSGQDIGLPINLLVVHC